MKEISEEIRMSTGDFSNKKYDCPNCLMVNNHPDCSPQINFCAYCKRAFLLYSTDLNKSSVL